MRRKVIVAVVQLLVVQLFITAGVANAQTKKVACVGDSITAPPTGWCSYLGMALGSGYMAQTFGVSGTTLLKNVGQPAFSSSNQYKPSHDFAPDIVVIMLGTNDSMPRNWDAGKDHFVADYKELIDSYTSLPSKPTVFLNTVPPASNDNMFTISGMNIEKEINPLIKQVAMEKMCPLVDVWAACDGDVTKLDSFDGVHPGTGGAMIIGNAVAEAIKMPMIPGGAAGMGGAAGAAGGSVSGAAGAGQAGSSANASGAGAAGQASSSPGAGGTTAAAAAGTSGAAVGAKAGSGAPSSAMTAANASSLPARSPSGAAGVAAPANAAGSTASAANAVTSSASSTPTSSDAESSDGGGCRAAGGSTSQGGPAAALMLFVALVLRNRRRSSRS